MYELRNSLPHVQGSIWFPVDDFGEMIILSFAQDQQNSFFYFSL